MKPIFILFFFIAVSGVAQNLQGVVLDENENPIIGALVVSDEGSKTRSDEKGLFSLSVEKYPIQLTLSFIGYETVVQQVNQSDVDNRISFKLLPTAQQMEGVVVSASRREQKIEEITVSLEIIKPELIENKALTNTEEAVNQAPGVYAMDGQVSIRGGSGFSYGAGSRVMVVWNDVPLLSADAGDAKWQSIPIENIGQIEVLKGASSVLYGSGALNGIIALRDKELTRKGETKLSYQAGVYDRPRREGLRWTNQSLFSRQFNAYHGKMFDKFGYSVSVYDFRNDGFRAGEEENRFRFNGSFVFKPEKLKRFKAGLNYSVNMERRGLFIIWESDSLGYQPSGGTANPFSDTSTLAVTENLRINIDPYLKWYDKYNNKHSIQTRYYLTDNRAQNGQSAAAAMYYADYKFERNFRKDFILTTGLTGVFNAVDSELYGDHDSRNYALYAQIEKSIGKLNLIGGVRGEYFQQNELSPDSRTYFSSDSSSSVPVRPILRFGANYQLKEFTFLRASFGQAIRYPSVAERYASTSIGALNIFPNQTLLPERGWSAELAVKQGFKISNFKGFIDVAGFINEYSNMMEFTFGYFKPDSIPISFNPNDPGFPQNWFGFRAENAEQARITGVELSINGTGKIGPVEVTALMGYTYMNPIVLNPDSAYIYGTAGNGGLSDTSSNMLKYRFRHLAKGDIQFKYKKLMFGFSGRYNSFMENIDASFETGINVLGSNVPVLVGLEEYRERNNGGDVIFDTRIGYQLNEQFLINFVVNNVFNEEYMTRPGDIRAPRQFLLRFQAKF
jgi:iron complex outermembrane receptor protein